MGDFEPKLSQLNAKLKAERAGVRVEARGQKLSLVATLPPKPGSDKLKPRQQRIALGLYANAAGLRRAERLARLLSIQLAEGAFSWAEWAEAEPDAPRTGADLLRGFQEHVGVDDYEFHRYFLQIGLKELPQDREPTQVDFERIALRWEANTRTRKAVCENLIRFAKWAGIPCDLSRLKGSYSPRAVEPRDIPPDEVIAQILDGVSNARWRNVFALCACYGLRPHEAWFCELEDLEGVPVLRVLEGKTGARYPVFPWPAEWVGRWLSSGIVVPKTSCTRHPCYGARAAQAWRRQTEGLDWTLYALRHAYAIRLHLAGVPPAVAAQWMGHSVAIHQSTYQRWISERHHLEVYRRLLGG